MFNSLGLGNILGSSGIAGGYGGAQQQSGQLNSPLGSQIGAQQAALYNQQLTSIHARQAAPAKWRVDGRDMTFQEFVETVFPEDTPERTLFLLKYSK